MVELLGLAVESFPTIRYLRVTYSNLNLFVNHSLRVRWPAERIATHANEGLYNFDQLVIFVTDAGCCVIRAQFLRCVIQRTWRQTSFRHRTCNCETLTVSFHWNIVEWIHPSWNNSQILHVDCGHRDGSASMRTHRDVRLERSKRQMEIWR
jgi:hypothetical protein